MRPRWRVRAERRRSTGRSPRHGAGGRRAGFPGSRGRARRGIRGGRLLENAQILPPGRKTVVGRRPARGGQVPPGRGGLTHAARHVGSVVADQGSRSAPGLLARTLQDVEGLGKKARAGGRDREIQSDLVVAGERRPGEAPRPPVQGVKPQGLACQGPCFGLSAQAAKHRRLQVPGAQVVRIGRKREVQAFQGLSPLTPRAGDLGLGVIARRTPGLVPGGLGEGRDRPRVAVKVF